MNKARLVCIVNTYNCSEFIEQCINSLLSQKTNYLFDIVVIDDCSSDNTRDIISNIQKNNPKENLHFFSTKKNTGVGKKALSELEEQIKAFLEYEYLYRIDSDDYLIDNSKFEKQISFLEANKECIGICHHYKILDEINNIETVSNDSIIGVYSGP